MKIRNFSQHTHSIMPQSWKCIKSLKTEDKIILGLGAFVGVSAISFVFLGGMILKTFSPPAEHYEVVTESFQQFDDLQNEFSQHLRRGIANMAENHLKITEKHDALMKDLSGSTEGMQEELEAHMKETHDQMEKNWKRIEKAAMKSLSGPLTLLDENMNIREEL